MYTLSMLIRKRSKVFIVLFFTLSAFLTLSLSSCSSDNESEALKSIRGTWDIKEIYSAYGERQELGLAIDWDTTQVLDSGFFNFSADNKGSFSFIRLDTSYASTNLDWNLTRERLNCGFTQCDFYTIDMEGVIFECQFGDQTDDAHINATEMRLIEESTELGPYRQIIYFLEKN